MKLKSRTLLPLAALALTAASARADLVATDLNTGGTDTGFSGGWTGSSGVGIQNAPDLIYGSYKLTQSGTTERVYNHYSTHPDRQDKRNLATAMSGEIWFSVLVNIPTGGDFIGLSFNNNSANAYSHVNSDLRVLMTPTQLQVSFDGGAMVTGTGTFAAGSTHLILGKMIVAAGNDTLNVWVDPDLISASDPGDLPAANFTSTTVDFADSISDVGVPGADGGVTISLDAIWLSDTATAFDDVTGAGIVDNTDPVLAAVDPLSPADDGVDVPVVSDLMVTFDENVAFGTGFIRIKKDAGDALVEEFNVATPPAGLTLSADTVTINPTNSLEASTLYYVEIESTAIDDISGNSFAGITDTTSWSFTTNSDATPPTVDTIDDPTNGASNVPITSSLVLTFDEDVQKGSGNIVIKRTSDNFVVDTIDVTSVTVSGDEVTIVPTDFLPELTGLYVEIDAGAILDLVSNPFGGIAGSGTWSFTTAAIPTALVATDINAGGTDTGFDAGWQHGSNNAYPTDASDLTYANYGIAQTGTVERVYASNSTADRQDYRNLEFPMSGDIWFSVLLYAPTGADFAALSFNHGSPVYETLKSDLRIWLTASEVQVGFNGGGASSVKAAAPDTTHLVLGQMNVAAGNDTISIWVDPDVNAAGGPGGLPAADFTSTTVDFTDSILNIGAGGDRGTAAEVHVDAIRLSNTASAFLDVTGVSGGGDTTPPVWVATWPMVDTVTATGATARAQIDEAGTAYYVVVADGAGAPASAQVVAGNDSGDFPAIASGSIALTATVEGTDAITGLTASTLYDAYFVAQDDEGSPNLQASPVLVEFTTLSSSTPYETWASGGELFGDDENGDGVSNGLAFLLGAADPDADATGLLPTGSESGGDLVLTFSMRNAANRGSASMATQHSSDLGATDAWDAAGNQETVPEGPGTGIVVGVVSFDVTANGTLNDVVATIPGSEGSAGKLFGRLLGTE